MPRSPRRKRPRRPLKIPLRRRLRNLLPPRQLGIAMISSSSKNGPKLFASLSLPISVTSLSRILPQQREKRTTRKERTRLSKPILPRPPQPRLTNFHQGMQLRNLSRRSWRSMPRRFSKNLSSARAWKPGVLTKNFLWRLIRMLPVMDAVLAPYLVLDTSAQCALTSTTARRARTASLMSTPSSRSLGPS